MSICANCGCRILDMYNDCPNCGYSLISDVNNHILINPQMQSYKDDFIKKQKRKRFLNRLLFVLLELISLPITILLSIVVQLVLDSSFIFRNLWILGLIWVAIVHWIYSKFKYRIM